MFEATWHSESHQTQRLPGTIMGLCDLKLALTGRQAWFFIVHLSRMLQKTKNRCNHPMCHFLDEQYIICYLKATRQWISHSAGISAPPSDVSVMKLKNSCVKSWPSLLVRQDCLSEMIQQPAGTFERHPGPARLSTNPKEKTRKSKHHKIMKNHLKSTGCPSAI